MKTDHFRVITWRRLFFSLAAFVMSAFIHHQVYSQNSAFDQEEDTGGSFSSGFRWGVKVGANLNQFNQPGTMVGFTGGLIGNYQVTDFFTAQGELLYTMSGGGRADHMRDLSNAGSEILAITYYNRSVVMQNVEIPLMGYFTLPELNEGAIVPRLGVGASYAYCLSAFEFHDKIYTLGDGTQTLLGNKSENILSDIEVHQFAANIGLAIDYKLAEGKIMTTEMRYKYGLNDVNLYKSLYTGSAQFPTTLSFMLSLTF